MHPEHLKLVLGGTLLGYVRYRRQAVIVALSLQECSTRSTRRSSSPVEASWLFLLAPNAIVVSLDGKRRVYKSLCRKSNNKNRNESCLNNVQITGVGNVWYVGVDMKAGFEWNWE